MVILLFPSPDNPLLDDRQDEVQGLAPAARVTVSEIAQNMNDNHLAAQFVRASLHRHYNPVKLCQSYTKLGELLMAEKVLDSSD